MIPGSNNPRNCWLKELREVCGFNSEVYRDLMRALATEDDVDLMLAQASFDALPAEKRRQIYQIVEDLAAGLTAKDMTKAAG